MSSSSSPCIYCGGCGCECSRLPYAAQATFSELTNKTRVMPCVVEFQSCFGQGVSAIVTDPGGCPEHTHEYCGTYCPPAETPQEIIYPNDGGPLTGVLLTSGGANYACVGRDDPSGMVFAAAVPAGNAPPTGVWLRPSRAAVPENTILDAPLRVAEIMVVDDGKGENTITLTGPDAAAFVVDGRMLFLKQGIALNFEVKSYYRVVVTVADEDLEDTEAVTAVFTLVVTDRLDEPGDTKTQPGIANPPSAPPNTTQGGAEEATFTPVFTKHAGEGCNFAITAPCWPSDLELPERPYWSIESCEVTGGRFYEGEEPLVFTAVPGVVEEEAAVGYVIADEAGTPTGVKMLLGGKYYAENRDPDASIVSPVIGCVSCGTSDTSYILPDGRKVTYPGPTKGDTGARIIGVVEKDPENEKFGEVVELEIELPGESVLGWQWGRSCLSLLNDKPITLFGGGESPVSFRLEACFGEGACIVATAAPPRYEPQLRIYGKGTCHNVIAGPQPPPLYGCGAYITYETEQSFEDDDETKPVWSITSISAIGGQHYENNAPAYVFVHDPVTSRPDYKCPILGRPPVIRLQASGGIVTGATLEDGGAFYLERPYFGEPSPVERLWIKDGGGAASRVRRGEPLVTVYPRNNPGFGYTFTPILEQRGDVWTIKSVVFELSSNVEEWEVIPYIESAMGGAAIHGRAGDLPELWLFVHEDGRPKEVRVIDGGAFWNDTVEAGDALYAVLGRVPPTLKAMPESTVKGSGAQITLAVSQKADQCGRDFWYVKSAEVSGGANYRDGEPFFVETKAGDISAEPARLAVRASRSGVPVGMVVVDSGKYWRESVTAPPYVSPVTVREVQLPPSQGKGAEIKVTIDDDPESPTFGTVTKASVTKNGSGYVLATGGCGYHYGDCGVDISLSPDASTLGLGSYDNKTIFTGKAVAPNCDSWSTSLAASVGGNAEASVVIEAPVEPWESCDGAPVCYERCPDIRLLCMTVTFTTPLGVAVKTTKDFLFNGAHGRIASGSVTASFAIEETNLFLEATLYVSCQDGELSLLAGWAGLPSEDCFCTSAAACGSVQCADGNWWETERTLELKYDEFSDCEACSEPGSVVIAITTPEEVAAGC